jgi:hypothetical protein
MAFLEKWSMKISEATRRIAITETNIRLRRTDKVLVINLGSRNILAAKIAKKKEKSKQKKPKIC